MLAFQISLPSKSKQTSSPLPEKTNTCLPSVLGDAPDVVLPSSFILRPSQVMPTFFFHSSLPAVETHSNTRLPLSALVRKIRSPQTIGVAPLSPGNSSFQRMFSVVLHLVGRFFSVLRPLLV